MNSIKICIGKRQRLAAWKNEASLLGKVSLDTCPFILGYIAKYPRQTAWNMPRTRLRLSHRYVGEALNTDVREAGKMQKAEEAAPGTGQPLADIIAIS